MQLIMKPNLDLDRREMAFFDSRDGFSLGNLSSNPASLTTMLNKTRAFLGNDDFLNPVAGKTAGTKFYLAVMRYAKTSPAAGGYFYQQFAASALTTVSGFTSRKDNTGNVSVSYSWTGRQTFPFSLTLLRKFYSGASIDVYFPEQGVYNYSTTPTSVSCSIYYDTPYTYQLTQSVSASSKSPIALNTFNQVVTTGEFKSAVNLNLVQYLIAHNEYQGRGFGISGTVNLRDVATDGLVYTQHADMATLPDETVNIDRAVVWLDTKLAYFELDGPRDVVPGSRPKVDLSRLSLSLAV